MQIPAPTAAGSGKRIRIRCPCGAGGEADLAAQVALSQQSHAVGAQAVSRAGLVVNERWKTAPQLPAGFRPHCARGRNRGVAAIRAALPFTPQADLAPDGVASNAFFTMLTSTRTEQDGSVSSSTPGQ